MINICHCGLLSHPLHRGKIACAVEYFCFDRVQGDFPPFVMYVLLSVYIREGKVEEVHLALGVEGRKACVGPYFL